MRRSEATCAASRTSHSDRRVSAEVIVARAITSRTVSMCGPLNRARKNQSSAGSPSRAHFEVQQRGHVLIAGEPVAPVTVSVHRDDCPCRQRRSLSYRGQAVGPLHPLLGPYAWGRTVHPRQAHAGSRPCQAGVAGVANLAGPQPTKPAAEQRGSQPGGQVRRERDLSVQSRVACGVDDLHHDIRADVDVMGAALCGGHGARIAAQRRTVFDQEARDH